MDPRHQGFFLVIVTYNRANYLSSLLASVAALNPAPDAVVVVDNASTDGTAAVIATAAAASAIPLIQHRLPENRGGSGGFSAGVERALDSGANWLWLMDDDVEALPDAVGAFRPWMERYECIIGRRYDSNGKPFFWQHNFNTLLGLALPVPGNVFSSSNAFATNVGCFEGMLISAEAARSVGLPDPRFFLNWDDMVYGWLISLQRPVVYVNEFVLRKVRPQKQIDLGIRHLNDSSDLARYYVMRNRAYVAKYLQAHGRYNAFGFAAGTALTACKEMLRLLAVEHRWAGTAKLWSGWRDSRGLFHDDNWQPMPPLPGND